MRVLSGIQPTGRFHWGNYFGAIRQYIALQEHDQAFYFIADLHALTTVRDAALLEEYTIEAAIDLLALGLNPDHATLFRQSDIPEVTELTWILLTATPMSLLEKCHAYKDKMAKGLSADAGLFTYPVLMAADILLYDSHIVPVGHDQVQHIEVTRDVAQKINSHYGDVLVLPEARVLDDTAKVPGIDGEKMSKSYGNVIEIFEAAKPMKKKVMSIKTDSQPVEASKNPETCHVFQMYRLFATADEQIELAQKYRAGGMGYGDAKKLLYDAAWKYFEPARERREELVKDKQTVRDILKTGAERARLKGQEVLDRVRSACGLGKKIV